MRMTKMVLAISCFVLSLAASGVTVIPLPTGEKPKTGVWYSSFTALKEQADAEGRPLVLLASSTGCSQCSTFGNRVFNDAGFQKWVAQQPYYFCKVTAISGNWSSGEKSAILKTVGGGSLPRFSVYWNRKNYDGQQGYVCKDITVCAYSYDVAKTESYIIKYAGDYKPTPSYAGGEFAQNAYVVTNGVEKSVVLRLVREAAVKDLVATNWVATSFNGGAFAESDRPIAWGPNETAKEYTCDLDVVGIDYSVMNVYALRLLSADREVKSTATVTALPYPYKGGKFVTSTEVHACLEADSETAFVDIPLTRTSGEAWKQKYVLSAPGKKSVTNEFTWAKGVLSGTLTLDMVDWYAADKVVTITLLDELGYPSGATTVACVGTVPNSSANPYWIGERTAETLAWGEWTMDLDAATQKVAAAEGEAFTLILVGGSKWCPDCVKTDRWLLDQPAFSVWAQNRKVVCVNIDLPKVSTDAVGETKLGAYPSLLSYETYDTVNAASSNPYRYIEACEDGAASRYQSGAGYLSRHSIPMTGNGGVNATDVAARNARLFLTGTDAGGLCRPDCLDEKNEQTGIFKTGLPCLIVMDKNGRIIGRNFQFNNESPDKFEACYIDRLDELLAQAADTSEETNDSRLTTKDVLPLRGNTGTGEMRKTVSYNDVNDWYRVPDNATGLKVEYCLKGEVDAEVMLSVVRTAGKASVTIQSVTNTLNKETRLCVERMPSNCFVRVSVPLTSSSWGVTSGYFALTNAATTVAHYVLESDAVLQPTEGVQTYSVAPGDDMSVTVEIVKGKVYKFDGEGVITDSRLAYNLEQGVYVANESGNVIVPLEKTSFTYQIWNTGLLAFDTLLGTAKEPAQEFVEYTLRVKRSGGVSSVGKVRINVDQSRSTSLPGIYEFADGIEHTWAEGDADDWTVPVRILANDYSDGDQQVVFVLTPVAGSAVGLGAINEHVLTIQDNDSASPGKVQIASVSPVQVGGTVYAKAGSSVLVTLDRTEGSDGVVGCTLSTTVGSLDKTAFAWPSRDTSAQTAMLSLVGIAAGATARVTLTPAVGTKAVTTAKTFTVQVVAEDAPSFVTNAVTYTVHRRVAVPANRIAVDNCCVAGAVKVTKIAGSIPGGIKAEYDSLLGALVFSGVPTAAAGRYDAVYRVSAGSVKGLVVSVTFRVIDPVKAATQTGVPLNAACAKMRTFSDLQVYTDEDWSRLIGLVTVTIPSSGRLSAKYICASGTVSLVSKNWSLIATDGALTAELGGTTAKTAGYKMSVTAFADGSLTCFFRDPTWHDKSVQVLRAGDSWNQLDEGAAEWQGYYTASLSQRQTTNDAVRAKGDGYMTFRMTSDSAVRKGRMAYAGVLPNGKAFSGARTLWGYYYEPLETMALAFLPVFNVSSSDDVSGLVLITPNAREEHKDDRRSIYNDENTYELFNTNKFVWVCKEGANAGKAFETEFDVYGGYYDADEDFAGCCVKTFETDVLTFFVLPQLLDPLSSWSTNDTGVSAARVAGKNALTLLEPYNDQRLTLSFNRTTGLVSGNLDLTVFGDTVRASYKGVVMPGWGSASCAECSTPSDAQKRPFVSGTCIFKDGSLTYACPFSIGVEEGR